MPTRGRWRSSSSRPRRVTFSAFSELHHGIAAHAPLAFYSFLLLLILREDKEGEGERKRERRKSERVVYRPTSNRPRSSIHRTSATAQVRQSRLPPIPIFSPPNSRSFHSPSSFRDSIFFFTFIFTDRSEFETMQALLKLEIIKLEDKPVSKISKIRFTDSKEIR